MRENELIVLTKALSADVRKGGETAMGGFYVGNVVLKDGSKYKVEISNSLYIFYVEGYNYVPFSLEDIKEIYITHDKINIREYGKREAQIVKKGLINYDRIDFPTPGSIPVASEKSEEGSE